MGCLLSALKSITMQRDLRAMPFESAPPLRLRLSHGYSTSIRLIKPNVAAGDSERNLAALDLAENYGPGSFLEIVPCADRSFTAGAIKYSGVVDLVGERDRRAAARLAAMIDPAEFDQNDPLFKSLSRGAPSLNRPRQSTEPKGRLPQGAKGVPAVSRRGTEAPAGPENSYERPIHMCNWQRVAGGQLQVVLPSSEAAW